VLLGDVVDEFLNNDGLADARAAEEADLATLQEGLDQVDDLDAGLEHLFARRLLVEKGRGTMDGFPLVLADWAEFVDWLPDNVDYAPERFFADWNADWSAEVDGFHATHHAIRGFHGDGTHAPFAQMLLYLEDHIDGRGHVEAIAGDAQRLVDGRHRLFFKLHVHRGTGNLDYLADVLCHKSAFVLERRRARYDFDDFLGDGRLPHAIHLECVGVDHVRGVVCC
jgi:hypothetical protein